MDIQDTTAIITGGASGLGAATAKRLVKQGATIAIFDLNDTRGTALETELGEQCRYYRVDVTSEDSVRSAIAKIEGTLPPIRVCCNFAGIGRAAKTLTKDGPHPLDMFRAVVEINLTGTFNVLRLAAESMAGNVPTGDDGLRGVIINTASIAAFEGQIGQAAYSASKGGIVGMTLPIARDLASLGIRCNTIAPGLIHTPLFDSLPEKAIDSLSESILNPKRLGRPDEIARTVQHIIENDYINGACIRVDGGTRMPPR